MKLFKVILINILILISAFALIEIFFGYWFDEDNLGPYMREHRMKKNSFSIKYDEKTYNFIYKRNYYGFRGEETNLEDIKIVLIGGSTADERYKPYEYTITGLLNKKLKKELNKEIINAGIEGQSTIGHIYNFEKWFSKLQSFNPEYFIFYIGINDHLRDPNDTINTDGNVINPSSIEFFKDNVKSRSIFYDLMRKIKHKYYLNKKKTISYDFDRGIKNFYKEQNFNFLEYDQALKIYDISKLKNNYRLLIDSYLNNIDILVKLSNQYNAKPIFINQLMHEGNNNKSLFILNYSLIEHCNIKKYSCIDLASKLKGQKEYWWDGVHTTPTGSQAIVDIIYPKLAQFIK